MKELTQPKFDLVEYAKCQWNGHDYAMNGSHLMTWCEKCGRTLKEYSI